MKQLIKNLYYNTRIGHLVISIPKYLYELVMYRLLPEKMYLRIIFKQHFDNLPDKFVLKCTHEAYRWYTFYNCIHKWLQK
jgi:hypothetical protein